jgi:ribonuclease P protein component
LQIVSIASLTEAIFFIFNVIFNFNLYFISERFTLTPQERLKSRKTIQKLFKEGESFSHFPFRVIFIEIEDEISPLRAGFSVSARNFKKAVDRNRIKRLMRESYRLQKNNLKSLLEENQKEVAVFFIYTGNELPKYQDVFDKLGGALQRIEKILELK